MRNLADRRCVSTGGPVPARRGMLVGLVPPFAGVLHWAKASTTGSCRDVRTNGPGRARSGRDRAGRGPGICPMLEPTACRFWQVALQSGLMDANGLAGTAGTQCPPRSVRRRRSTAALPARPYRPAGSRSGRPSSSSPGAPRVQDRSIRVAGTDRAGGMGRVYLARDSRLNRRVALKILSPERVNNPAPLPGSTARRWSAHSCQHENLVRIYDEGESSGRCYLVMEYIEGRNIGQIISETVRSRRPSPPVWRARWHSGWSTPSSKGLIHRDVNPYNILVTRDGVAKLTDMGLAIDLAGPGTRDPRRCDRRHVRLRLPRAGPSLARRRYPERHLLARVHALSHAFRSGPIPQLEPCRRSCSATRRPRPSR